MVRDIEDDRAIETLTSLAKVYEATSGIEDDSSEDVIIAALRRDLPIALAIIDRQASEIERLRGIAAAAREYRDRLDKLLGLDS